MSMTTEEMKDVEGIITERMKPMEIAERVQYIKRQKNAMNKAMRNFRKIPSAENWSKLEIEMLYFQQSTYVYHRFLRIPR